MNHHGTAGQRAYGQILQKGAPRGALPGPGCVTLRSLLDSGKPLPLVVAIQKAILLCEALDEMHQQGIVHGELNSGNVYLLDDGSVWLIGPSGTASERMEIGIREGASLKLLAGLSPEQVMGQPGNVLSDIFCLGILLYQLLTLQEPFTGENTSAILESILNDSPSFPSGIPVEVCRIVRKALEKDPQDRYSTAAEMGRDLQKSELRLRQALSSVTPVSGFHPSRFAALRTFYCAGGVLDDLVGHSPLFIFLGLIVVPTLGC